MLNLCSRLVRVQRSVLQRSLSTTLARHADRQAAPRSRVLKAFDTSITRDVLLFQYDNIDQCRKMLRLAVCSCVGAFVGFVVVSPEYEDSAIRRIAGALILAIGNLLAVYCMIHMHRSVHRLLLTDKGKSLTIVTNSVRLKPITRVVPLNNVKFKKTRADAGIFLKMYVKSSSAAYYLDMDGQFVSPHVFDLLVCVDREFFSGMVN